MSSFTYKIKKQTIAEIDFEVLENNNLIDIGANPVYLKLEITNNDTKSKSAQVYLAIPTALNSLTENKFLIKSSATTIIEKQNSNSITLEISEDVLIPQYSILKFGILNSYITPLINSNSSKTFKIKVSAQNDPFIGAVNIEVE
ncbi:hypothetical protein UFOVP724_149 [uncultured Caudovirales phage]|uniref:Uncharacterized protein n=1 Tax=uncultured Caudovirales phage TaxID=2100421 RepID=A0A6J5NYM9_9CAUD|nr:hypothetical protein UFOVP724_149 [uncultured Caudovirales phage]